MSLSQILDDIQDGVTNTHVSTEDAVVPQQKESAFKLPSSNLDKSVLNKFNTLYNVLNAKKTIYPLNKVDLKIAQEVFTMLPDVSKSDQAKVTSFPSTINKDLLEGMLKNVDDKMPDEILTVFKDILEQIRNNADAITGVVEAVKVYGEVCKVQRERLTANRPLVIVDRESRDLFQEDLYRCSYIDDTQLDYAKYSGVLSEMFRKLAEDPTLGTFLTYRSNPEEGAAISRYPEISLFGLTEKIIHLMDVLVSNYGHLDSFAGSLDMAINDEVKAITANSTYLVNNANGVVETLEFFKMLHDILEQEDHFFEKTKKLMEFLD